MPRLAKAASHLLRSSTRSAPSPFRTLVFSSYVAPRSAAPLQAGPSSAITTVSSLRQRFRSSPSSLLSSYSPLSVHLSFSSSLLASTSFQQVRGVTYGSEYQPSQRVRKRRHGFLARRRSRGGRKVLIRRRLKGRRWLSH